MKLYRCEMCGADDFTEQDGLRICRYCGSKYHVTSDDANTHKTRIISLDDDVQILLKKCELDPQNAKKYANLVLDIDPLNEDAKKYL